MRGILTDWKVVIRRLLKAPGFSATAVAMLAFGIGATTATFSIVDGVLLKPLPFPDPSRLVTLGDEIVGTGWGSQGQGPVTATGSVAYTRDTHSFSSLGTYAQENLELSGAGQPVQLNAERMTAGVFSALGVAPMMGRVFTQQEDADKARVAVLSYGTWKSRFGGDPGIVGTKILLNREPYVVIGVMPRSFEFPIAAALGRTELWVPMSFTADELNPEAGGDWAWQMVGRLKPGVTREQAEQDARQVAQEIMRNLPPDIASFRIRPHVLPLAQVTLEQARPILRMLFLAVLVVLLIACANLAGLLLVRAIRHQREIAVRLALGAPAAALVRQALLESLTLSLSGAVLGIGLAGLAVILGSSLLPASLPRTDNVSLNWAVAGFALVVAMLTGLVCGLVPAFAALRTNVNACLKEGGRSGSAGGYHTRLRAALVVAEVSVALTLLTASGLLLRSFQRMSNVDLGFRPDHVVTAQYALPREQYGDQERVDAFDRELLARLRQLPGTEAAAVTTTLPGANYFGLEELVVDGYSEGRNSPVAAASGVVGDFFRAVGISLLRGRLLSETDNADAPLVVVVNREFAERYWPGENPLGKLVRLGTEQMKTPWLTVVGEVGDAKLSSPDRDAQPQIYQPVAQMEKDVGSFATPGDINGNAGYIVLRSVLPPETMENSLRRTVQRVDAQLPLTHLETMDEVVAESESSRRFNMVVVSSFAAAAVLLAALGIYSVIAFSVAARVQEMAIRMALGAPRSGILRLVLGWGVKLAGIGCAIGLAGAWGASSLLRSWSLLFGVSPFDPVTMLLALAAVLLLALLASALPARKAAQVDPMQALRGE